MIRKQYLQMQNTVYNCDKKKLTYIVILSFNDFFEVPLLVIYVTKSEGK